MGKLGVVGIGPLAVFLLASHHWDASPPEFPEFPSFDKRSHASSKETMEGRNKVFSREETVSAASRLPLHFLVLFV